MKDRYRGLLISLPVIVIAVIVVVIMFLNHIWPVKSINEVIREQKERQTNVSP